ncbi:MAG: peptide chain release factor 1 [bacterium]|nr:peptide chain release factor 1 [bacterium]
MLSEKKLQELMARREEIDALFMTPDITRDQKRYTEISRERIEITDVLDKYHELKEMEDKLEETRVMVRDHPNDLELQELIKAELVELEEKRKQIEAELKLLLIKKDPNDSKNIFMELRAGAGGEEASIFVADLFRMYQRYCEGRKWKVEIVNSHASDMKGFKELVISISGKDVYSFLKYESGVHRVQRVPLTEAQGRVHTSTVTVAVLPEIEEVDIYIDPKDLRIDVYRSSGAGGQYVNKTDSAVRITHLPTGVVVTSQDQRSQLQNRVKAMQVLRAKLYEKAEEEKNLKISQERKSQIGTGERSEKTRTYNYPQNRVTDHRIGLSLYKLDKIMDGDLDEIISSFQLYAENMSM